MEQLLEIKTVPISFEFKIHHAKLEMSSDLPKQQGIVDFRDLTPYTPKLYIDSREFRNQTKQKRETPPAQSSYEKKILESMNATTDFAKGSLLMNTQSKTSTLSSVAFQHFQPTLQTAIGIPSSPADFNWDAQQLSMQYETDRMNYNWISQNKPRLKFTPASVEFVVKQYARVEIKYLGKPQYVPPSASPDYVPPELDVTA